MSNEMITITIPKWLWDALMGQIDDADDMIAMLSGLKANIEDRINKPEEPGDGKDILP